MNAAYTFGDRPIPQGICPQTAVILKNCYMTPGVAAALRKMKPTRQVEAAEHIVLSGNCSVTFAKGLLAVTKPEHLLTKVNRQNIGLRYPGRVKALQQQAAHVLRRLVRLRESYGRDMLLLTVYGRFLDRLLVNSQVLAYLSQCHPGALRSLTAAILTAKTRITKRRRNVLTIERSKTRLGRD